MYKVTLNEEQLKNLLDQVREDGGAEKRFDINLAEGKMRENLLARLLNIKAIEVKTDYKVGDTGNIVVEYMCNGTPSGIATTESDWWAFVLEGEGYKSEVAVLIKTDRLKNIARNEKTISGGDNNSSKMKVFKIEKLISKEIK